MVRNDSGRARRRGSSIGLRRSHADRTASTERSTQDGLALGPTSYGEQPRSRSADEAAGWSPCAPSRAARARRLPQLVGVDGELIDESGGRARSHRFHRRTEVVQRSGTVSILDVRVAADDDVLQLDVHGALQADGVLTVVIALSLQHPSRRAAVGRGERDEVEADTVVVPAGEAGAFALTFVDEHGCRVRTRGSVANLREGGS